MIEKTRKEEKQKQTYHPVYLTIPSPLFDSAEYGIVRQTAAAAMRLYVNQTEAAPEGTTGNNYDVVYVKLALVTNQIMTVPSSSSP